MQKTFINHVKTYATYSAVFGVPRYDKNAFVQLRKVLPIGGLLKVLSQLTNSKIDDKDIRRYFLSYIQDVAEKNS